MVCELVTAYIKSYGNVYIPPSVAPFGGSRRSPGHCIRANESVARKSSIHDGRASRGSGVR